MRLDQLRSFVEISKSKSLSIASEALHISQQALSLMVKEMEKELGFPLLIRSSRGIKLTNEGQIFTREINQILLQYDLLIHSLREEENRKPCYTVRIGMQYGVLEGPFSNIIEYLYREQKLIRLEVIETSKEQIAEGVKQGMYDLGMAAYNSIGGKSWNCDAILQEIVLFRGQLGARVAPGMALYDCETVSIKTALKEDIFMYQSTEWDTNGALEVVQYYAPNKKITIDKNYVLNQKKLLSGKGISFGIVEENNGDSHNDTKTEFRIIPFKENIEVAEVCLLRKGTEQRPEIRYILDMLQMMKNL